MSNDLTATTKQTRNTPARGRSLLRAMATRYGMEADKFRGVIVNTVLPANERQRVSNAQLAAFLLVAHEYDLNPLTREIYAFPTRGGGIQPIVSVDGWLKLINSHPQFDGMEFRDHLDDQGQLLAITCCIYRKDRNHPIEVTEYLAECMRDTDTWKKWPRRMLRHKAAIQAARYAFGFSGIVDEDEAERRREAEQREELTPPPPPPESAGSPDVMEAEVVEQHPHEDCEAALRGLEGGLELCSTRQALEKLRASWEQNNGDLPEEYQRQADEMFEATMDRIQAASKPSPLIESLAKALEACASLDDVEAVAAANQAMLASAPPDIASKAQEMLNASRSQFSKEKAEVAA